MRQLAAERRDGPELQAADGPFLATHRERLPGRQAREEPQLDRLRCSGVRRRNANATLSMS